MAFILSIINEKGDQAKALPRLLATEFTVKDGM